MRGDSRAWDGFILLDLYSVLVCQVGYAYGDEFECWGIIF
jgi:hypothetical protein